MTSEQKQPIPRFTRGAWESGEIVTRLGGGGVGGKAAGLWQLKTDLLGRLDPLEFPGIRVTVPRMLVLGTDVFDAFMDLNDLRETALEGASNARLSHLFLKATLPPEVLGDLRDFIAQVRVPLAVRSSSLLEDALEHPFAGVYATKMIPNHQADADARFQALCHAIRFVYAATYFKTAQDYFAGTGLDHGAEKMGVVIQEVVGDRHRDRHYPWLSGVARSFNYYPSGAAKPTDGVVNLALGLGRQIVDGGLSWCYSPAYPAAPPPFNNVGDRMRNTQTSFWAVNMGTPPPPDPMRETEYLLEAELEDAAADGVLDHLVSTYDHRSDRLRMGCTSGGPHVLDFAPILVGETLPLNGLLRRLFPLAERTAGCPVEIEFALDHDERRRPALLPAADAAHGHPPRRHPGRAGGSQRRPGGGGGGPGPGQRRPRRPGRRGLPQARGLRCRPHPRHRHGGRGGRPPPGPRGPALRADRLRPLGQQRSLAGRAGGVGADRRGQGHRRDRDQGHEPGPEPGRPFLPQPDRLRRLLPDGLGPGRQHRLGLAGGAAGGPRVGPRAPRPPDRAADRAGRRAGRPGRGGKESRMSDVHDLLGALRERAKELNCLYEVEKALTGPGRPLPQVLADVAAAIPPGWQYPEVCEASVVVEDDQAATPGWRETPWTLRAPIRVQDDTVGELRVCYREERPAEVDGPFLAEEVRLIGSLADRLGHWVLFRKLEIMGRKWRELGSDENAGADPSWRVLVDLLRETDDALFVRIARKMLNHLCSIGIAEAQEMLREIDADWDPLDAKTGESNVPEHRVETDRWLLATGRPFDVAARYLGGDEIIMRVQKWVQADKASQFLKALDNPRSTLVEVRDALRRFHQIAPDGVGLPESTLKSVRVALSQRVLTEQLDFVQAAKDEVSVGFFRELMDRIVAGEESHGKLGGKAAGMLLAHRVLLNRGARAAGDGNVAMDAAAGPLADVRIPRTWYVASDAVLDFIAYNDLEDLLHQKYKSIDEVRRDYPNIIRLFKNSTFPPALVQGLAAVLDEFEGVPLIVRSSSLLEDRVGTAFSGKYKSLFLPNQGTKRECLAALLDAVAEVYASMFGPDPIQYRRERGVLEFDEQMGVLIQEVVGRRTGK